MIRSYFDSLFGRWLKHDADPIRPARFMIVAQARSGSTFLRETLNAQPDVTCHGEILSRAWINKLVPAHDSKPRTREQTADMQTARDDDPIGFLQTHVLDFPAQTVGFKIIYEDFFHLGLDRMLQPWATENGVRVIHLRRLNPVAAFASRLRMQKYRISHSDAAGRPDGGSSAQKVHITPDDLSQFIDRQTRQGAQVDALFPAALRIEYENLAADYPLILSHLGLDGDRAFASPLRKMTPLSLADVIENYPEIADFDHPEQPVW